MLVALAQFVSLALFPWSLSIGAMIGVVLLAVLSAFLGWALWRRKEWARILTIFCQGFNVVIRLITLLPNVYRPERGLNAALLVTYVLSIVLSLWLLMSIDRPEVQLLFES